MGPKRQLNLNKTTGIKGTTNSAFSSQLKKPDWPSLEPPRDPEDLYLEETLPGQIFIIKGLWTLNLCKKYISFLSSLPLTTTPGKPKKGEAVRVNDRFQIDDPDFAKVLWEQTALQGLINGFKVKDVIIQF